MNAKIAAGQEKARDAAANHEQRHHRSAAIAEDVTKRKQQELAHGWLLRLRYHDNLSVAQANDAGGVLEQALVVRGEDEGEAEAAIQVAHQVD